MKILSLIAVLVIIAMPLSASAATFFAEEAVVPLSVTPDDLYAAGGQLDIQHAVDGDVMLAGNSVTIAGPIDGDVFAVGEAVTVSGTVADDTLVAGNTVSISAPSMEDLFAAGASVTISPQTNVTGDAFLAGETVVISGNIAGDVRVAGDDIRVTDGTTIGGNLVSYSYSEPQLGDDVIIGGEAKHTQWNPSTPSAKSAVLGWVRAVVSLFIGAAVLLYLMPASSQRIVDTAGAKPAPSFCLGVLLVLLIIPVTIVLMITMIGMPLAILLIGLALALGVAAWLYSALIVGERIFSWSTKKQVDKLTWQHALIGAVAMSVVGLSPIIGWLVATIIIVATLGAIVLVRWNEFRTVNE